MRKLTGYGAVTLGAVGVMFCLAAIGFGWFAALKTIERVNRTAVRVDQGLTKTDQRLARVEARLAAIRGELGVIQRDADVIGNEDPKLPRVTAEIERLLGRLIPAFEQLQDIADSIAALSGGLDALAELTDLFDRDSNLPGRIRNSATALDAAADIVNKPNAKIEEFKSKSAVKVSRELVELVREVIAGSERVADGLAATRRETVEVRDQLGVWRGKIITWIYVIAGVNTLIWLWCGLGQLCLAGWGRRRNTT